MQFDDLIVSLLFEAAPPLPPKDENKEGGGENAPAPDADAASPGDPEEGAEQGKGGVGEEGGIDAGDLGDLEDLDLEGAVDEKASPEEIELAKLAIRALYFNPESKSVHRYTLNVGGKKIPFEKVSDYFEKTKNWKPVLGFVEYVMDKFEGLASKWTEKPEVRGKGILDKIRTYSDPNQPEDERLDNGKRVYWARIILNALLHGTPSYNINMSDVNEKNIKEIYRKLKQDFGRDSRGLMPNPDLKGPGLM